MLLTFSRNITARNTQDCVTSSIPCGIPLTWTREVLLNLWCKIRKISNRSSNLFKELLAGIVYHASLFKLVCFCNVYHVAFLRIWKENVASPEMIFDNKRWLTMVQGPQQNLLAFSFCPPKNAWLKTKICFQKKVNVTSEIQIQIYARLWSQLFLPVLACACESSAVSDVWTCI